MYFLDCLSYFILNILVPFVFYDLRIEETISMKENLQHPANRCGDM